MKTFLRGACLFLLSIYMKTSFSKTRDIRSSNNIGPEISFLNVDKVWQETNITGKNIVVAVLDDGLYHNHVDLRANYNRNVSYDFVDNDTNPSPPSRSSSHGTKCAGIIATKFNGKCRTGIAYEAKLAGVRIFGQSSSSKDRTAEGLRYNKENIDVYSNSWGPKDNGHSIKGPGSEGAMALKHGALKGRNGLGSIFVFSSGNGGLFGDSCAFDGYVNSIYTIAIGAVTKTGAIPSYAERCSSIIASTYGDEVKTSDVFRNRCNSRFGRTSGAAALASGIVALLLDANGKLTWRDVQHLIVRTSNPRKTKIDGKDWAVNGAGLMVHPSVGFGVMDAKKLVDAAQHWTNVPKQMNCTFRLKRQNITLKRYGTKLSFPFPEECSIEILEHVRVDMTLSFYPRAYLLMDLISPAGTTSQLLYQRMFDAITRRKDYRGLKVTSLHFWGENPIADTDMWTIQLKSTSFRRFHTQVKLYDFKVTFYGTTEDPISRNTFLPTEKILCPQDGKTFWAGYGSQCCGTSWAYDPDHERCCGGTNKIVEKSPLCGDQEYNKCEELCCDGTLLNITRDSEEMFCCGDKKYNKKEDVCCGGAKHTKFSCRKKWFSYRYGWGRYARRYARYIKHKVECPNGRSLTYGPIYPYKACKPSKEMHYCADKKYSKAKQVCCGGKLYPKSSCKKIKRYKYIWYLIHEAKCSKDGLTLKHVPKLKTCHHRS